MIDSSVLDAALARVIALTSRIDITIDKPSSYADVAKVSLGYRTVPMLTGPEDCDGGRQVVVGVIEDGIVTARGTPRYWCLTGQSRLLWCGETLLDQPPVMVVPGIAFKLPSIRLRFLG